MGQDVEVLQVSAGVLALENGRVLLARRSAGRTHAGLWEFPGGKLEQGESPPASLIREFQEELGLHIEVLTPVTTVEGHLPSGRPLRLLAYRVRPLPPVPEWVGLPGTAGDWTTPTPAFPDHDCLAWPRPEELAEYPMPQVDVGIARALQEGG